MAVARVVLAQDSKSGIRVIAVWPSGAVEGFGPVGATLVWAGTDCGIIEFQVGRLWRATLRVDLRRWRWRISGRSSAPLARR